MIDDPDALRRQAAYIDSLRGVGRQERTGGFVASLVGVMALVWARFNAAAPAWGIWIGLAIIALGWFLLIYSLIKRSQWVRTHPFDAQTSGPHG